MVTPLLLDVMGNNRIIHPTLYLLSLLVRNKIRCTPWHGKNTHRRQDRSGGLHGELKHERSVQ
ncbi:hypothetical protein U9M48_037666 [Paspalum notatum var. saurae]|uniref:Uncharacterized protein n=1 Tax=Paspalum notatum var. saurae TaxID=547442 RepID=A0AAQ3UFD3_PASNO